MTPPPGPPPRALSALRRRRSPRGQAAVIVCLMLVALLAIAGLAIDGGMEAGNFRAAQNAADAAATAAARWAYNYYVTNGSAPTSDQVTAYADTILDENHAAHGAVAVRYAPGGGRPQHASGADGDLAYQLAGVTTTNTTSGSGDGELATVSVPLLGDQVEVSATHVTASTGGGTPSSSATADAAKVTIPPLASITALGVVSTSSAPTQGTQSGSSVTNNYGALGAQSVWANVVNGTPEAAADQQTVNATTSSIGLPLGVGSMTVAANVASESNSIIGGSTPVSTADVVTDNLSVTLPGNVSITAPVMAFHLALTGSGGQVTSTVTCSPPATLTITVGLLGLPYSVPLTSGCQLQAPLVAALSSLLSAAGITLAFDQVSPAGGCAAGATSCSVSACFLRIGVAVPLTGVSVATACVAQADAALSVTGGTVAPTPTPPQPSDFSISANPSSITLNKGDSGSTSICTTVTRGAAQNVGLTAVGLPPGATATFAPPSVTAGACSTMTINSGSAAVGTYGLTVIGTGSSATHSTAVTLTIHDNGNNGSTTSASSTDSTATAGPSTVYDPLSTPYEVTVYCHVPTPNFFLGILGWTGTNPTATATADVLQVHDVTDSAFTASPDAIPDMGTAVDNGTFYHLLAGTGAQSPIGHTFYLYGPSMQADYVMWNNGVAPAGWQGLVQASSGHAVGAQLTYQAGASSGPQPFVSGGSYVLLPVIDLVGVVEAYAVFTHTAGSNTGVLVDSIPASSGAFPQAITLTPFQAPWQPDAAWQADAIKLTT